MAINVKMIPEGEYLFNIRIHFRYISFIILCIQKPALSIASLASVPANSSGPARILDRLLHSQTLSELANEQPTGAERGFKEHEAGSPSSFKIYDSLFEFSLSKQGGGACVLQPFGLFCFVDLF